MSDCAYRFWQRHEPESWLYYRFFNRRKFALPGTVEGLEAAFAELAPNRAVRLASPPTLVLDGETVRPGKLAVMFVGKSREDVLALDGLFRERLEG